MFIGLMVLVSASNVELSNLSLSTVQL